MLALIFSLYRIDAYGNVSMRMNEACGISYLCDTFKCIAKA